MQAVYSPAQVQTYLQRINVKHNPHVKPTVDLLRTVHRSHCLTIPFENLSLVYSSLKNGIPSCEPEEVFTKLVLSKRGGWCFEMNGIMAWMLGSMGYKVWEGAARVVKANSLKPMENFEGIPASDNLGSTYSLTNRSHRVVFAKVDGETWLVDVGFGGQGLLEPVLLKAHDIVDGASSSSSSSASGSVDLPLVSNQAGTSYRLRYGILGSAEELPASKALAHPEAASHLGMYLQCIIKGDWVDLYWFDLAATTQEDFECQNYHCASNHPLFTTKAIVTMPTEEGRVTLVDYELKIRKAGQPTEVVLLGSDKERDQVLLERFGIDVTAKV